MEKEVICEGQEERWKNRNGWKKIKEKAKGKKRILCQYMYHTFFVCELLALKYMYFDQFPEVHFFSCDIRD